ncbi:MAG: glycosyltransferase [Candidatus Competibacteraceae bacterium]
MTYNRKVGLIVPTLNPGDTWKIWLQAFASQQFKPEYLLVIDSSSTDDTTRLARAAGFNVLSIQREQFNHGGTRQLGVDKIKNAEIIIFVTQDAIFAASDALEKLVIPFLDDKVGAAYGRQLPHPDARPIGAHARIFNYPPVNRINKLEDASKLGIKTAFISNSFAAYRRSALLDVGGFPLNTIMMEDTYVTGKMLLAGWKSTYCSDALVYHSHDYRFIEEFRRYFDIGVFHSRESWLRQHFGNPQGEGLRFVKSELRYLLDNGPKYIPSAFLRTLIKYFGYKLGFAEAFIPHWLKSHLSMHYRYWQQA